MIWWFFASQIYGLAIFSYASSNNRLFRLMMNGKDIDSFSLQSYYIFILILAFLFVLLLANFEFRKFLSLLICISFWFNCLLVVNGLTTNTAVHWCAFLLYLYVSFYPSQTKNNCLVFFITPSLSLLLLPTLSFEGAFALLLVVSCLDYAAVWKTSAMRITCSTLDKITLKPAFVSENGGFLGGGDVCLPMVFVNATYLHLQEKMNFESSIALCLLLIVFMSISLKSAAHYYITCEEGIPAIPFLTMGAAMGKVLIFAILNFSIV